VSDGFVFQTTFSKKNLYFIFTGQEHCLFAWKPQPGRLKNEFLKPIETARLQTHGPFGKYRLKRIAKPDISERPCTMCIVCRMICVL
jgi:hypothetical protein